MRCEHMNKQGLMGRIAIVMCLALSACILTLPVSLAAPVAWTKLAGSGVTDTNNTALLPGHILKGQLTVGAASIGSSPVTMYTYDTAFHKLFQQGFGSGNSRLMPWGLYRDEIYIGTENSTTGGELWKWAGEGNPTLIMGNGWGGGAANYQVNPVAVFNDQLLVVVSNNTTGLRIYRFDGSNWTQVVGQGPAGTATGPGFGNPANICIDAGESRELNGRLILPVQNNTNGLQVYSYDGNVFSRVGQPGAGLWPTSHNFGYAATSFADNMLYMGTGAYPFPSSDPAQLWSYDGTTWTKIILSGDLGNASYLQPLVRGQDLYVTAWNFSDRCCVYKRTGSTFSAFSNKGFDGTSYNWTCLLASYNGMLFGLTGNSSAGEAWYTTIAPSIDRLVPAAGPYGTTVRIEGHDFGVTQGSSTVSFNNSGARVLSWSDTVITAEFPYKATAGPVVVATSRGASNAVTFTLTLSKTWYFAEGTTRDNAVDGNYEEWLCVQNPGDTDANLDITYMLADGSTAKQAVTVKKMSRSTISVNAALGHDKDVSTFILSDRLVLAERPMYFNYRNKWTGGHDVIGVPQPRTSYYFAEGTTRANPADGYFEEWLCFQNPGTIDASVDVDYLLGPQGSKVSKQYTVKAKSRRTVDVNLEVGPDRDVSAVVSSSQPIVAERPMYFNYHDKWTGGHDIIGAPGPDTVFYFAEGTTRDNAADGAFEEWISLQNANNEDARVAITYYTDQAGTRTQEVVVKGNSRQTVDVKLELGADVDASFMVTSDRSILAERPMYFNYHNAWDGGHDVVGCAQPKKQFYFAEGTTLPGFATWIAVMNPGYFDTKVTFHYMLGDGTNKQVTATVKAHERYTRDVLADVGPDQDVSILVEGVNEIVVERPMYFSYHDWCTGGHDTVGYGI